jgi:hypothetical protein
VTRKFPEFSTLAATAAFCVFCSSVPAALAQSDIDPGIIDAQTGTWLVAPIDGDPGCKLTFTKDPTIGGYAVTGGENCATALPALKDTYAWHFSGGGLALVDPTRKVLARFEESEGAPWHTVEGRRLALVIPPGRIDHLPTQTALAGNWILRRPGGEILCRIKLAANPASNANGTMSPTGDCVSAVTRLKLEYFQVDTFDVTLMSGDGASLALTMRADGNFEKSRQEGGKPLLMVRP